MLIQCVLSYCYHSLYLMMMMMMMMMMMSSSSSSAFILTFLLTMTYSTHITYGPVARDSMLSLHNKLTIYKLLMCPILTYAAPVWSNTSLSNYRHLQVLQSECLRVISGYPRRLLSHTFIPPSHSNPFTRLFIA